MSFFAGLPSSYNLAQQNFKEAMQIKRKSYFSNLIFSKRVVDQMLRLLLNIFNFFSRSYSQIQRINFSTVNSKQLTVSDSSQISINEVFRLAAQYRYIMSLFYHEHPRVKRIYRYAIVHKIFFLLSVFTLLTGCNTELDEDKFSFQEENSTKFEDRFDLKMIEKFKLPLDDSISFYNRSLCYNRIANKPILSILNTLNSSIYFFDYDKRTFLYKIKLAKEGPNGVGKLDALSGHQVINKDSLLVLNYKQQQLYLLDSDGKTLKKFSLIEMNKKRIYAFASAVNKIIKTNSGIIIPCHIGNITKDEKSLSSFVKVDLNGGKVSGLFSYPDVYKEGAWLAQYKFMPYFTATSENKFIISYPIDPNIYVTNGLGQVLGKHYIGSKYFERCLPYSIENSEKYIKNISNHKVEEYLATSNMFNNIINLQSNNLFLREAYIAPTSDEYHINQDPYLKSSFIIFNEKFEKVGETLLPSKIYFTKISFVANGKFYIANEQAYQENENELTFDVFKIERK